MGDTQMSSCPEQSQRGRKTNRWVPRGGVSARVSRIRHVPGPRHDGDAPRPSFESHVPSTFSGTPRCGSRCCRPPQPRWLLRVPAWHHAHLAATRNDNGLARRLE
eukprot:157692-Chlamydomonas_euryale.AAC.3